MSSFRPVNSRSRGYLPHVEPDNKHQFITFRLADSLPQSTLKEIKLMVSKEDPAFRDSKQRKLIEQYLDQGLGCCALKHPEVAHTLQSSLLRFHNDRYQLKAWCIMPNHVHILITPNYPLGKIIQSWKSYSARWAIQNNQRLKLNISTKSFWLREYWDRFIRDLDHYDNVLHYIHNNPVKAKLCNSPEQWQWSSASVEIPE